MRRQRIAETKERVTVLLAAIAELGARAQIDLLKGGMFSLAEAVGATTRAIHDLQLLEGNATEITQECVTAIGRSADLDGCTRQGRTRPGGVCGFGHPHR